ncbi:MAG: M50 family metallopeptidase [Candidatus Woesearchaeota archaeon]|jgi:Zn-dependent protease|nr:M50 family metallopeptidase [Candidatus Woesearchaeota archaeon]
MPIITILEIIYFIILTLVVGYIFSGYIKYPRKEYDLIYRKSFFDWQDLKFAALITAPGVLLHELAHKFVAIYYGLQASFHIFWEGLGLAIFLKLINSPFLIVAPGYVSISQGATILQNTLISFAGPFMNLILFFASWLIINNAKKLTRKQAIVLYLTKQINLFLFIFNMLPIPPLDGFHVFSGLYHLIF